MALKALRRQAKEDARYFLENDGQYRMGYVNAERPHPVPRRLSQTYGESMEDGIRLIFSVDDRMAGRAAETLSGKALKRFMIGNEPAPERENAAASHALWVDAKAATESFYPQTKRYQSHSQLTLADAGLSLPETGMDLYGHLAVELMFNTLSTGVMARMGSISPTQEAIQTLGMK